MPEYNKPPGTECNILTSYLLCSDMRKVEENRPKSYKCALVLQSCTKNNIKVSTAEIRPVQTGSECVWDYLCACVCVCVCVLVLYLNALIVVRPSAVSEKWQSRGSCVESSRSWRSLGETESVYSQYEYHIILTHFLWIKVYMYLHMYSHVLHT